MGGGGGQQKKKSNNTNLTPLEFVLRVIKVNVYVVWSLVDSGLWCAVISAKIVIIAKKRHNHSVNSRTIYLVDFLPFFL